jgi:hypothetical protein
MSPIKVIVRQPHLRHHAKAGVFTKKVSSLLTPWRCHQAVVQGLVAAQAAFRPCKSRATSISIAGSALSTMEQMPADSNNSSF